MKTEKEIREKKHELTKEYTNLWVSVGNAPETNEVAKQVEILDWVLETKFITIK